MVEIEAGLMKIVWSVNRNLTHDSYFSLCRPINPGEKSGENVLGKSPDTSMYNIMHVSLQAQSYVYLHFLPSVCLYVCLCMSVSVCLSQFFPLSLKLSLGYPRSTS